MAKMIVIHKRPKNPERYDEHYFGTHVPLTKRVPGLKRYEVSRGPIEALGSSMDVHLVAILEFESVQAIKRALVSPEGQAALDDLPNLTTNPDDITVIFFESEAR